MDVGASEGADYCICTAKMSFELRLREFGLNMSQICISVLMIVAMVRVVPVSMIVIVNMIM